MARPRSVTGKARVIMAGLMDMIMAPPTPCNARKMTRAKSDGDMPQRTELTVNMMSPVAHRIFCPTMSETRPRIKRRLAMTMR